MNVIIGRNNSGKSALLDLVSFVTQDKVDISPMHGRPGSTPSVIVAGPLGTRAISTVFRSHVSGGDIPGGNHAQFGERLNGARIEWRLHAKTGEEFAAVGASPNGEKPLDTIPRGGGSAWAQRLAAASRFPLTGRAFRRIYAERDLVPEQDKDVNLRKPSELGLTGKGGGATNLIQNFLNKMRLPSDLVEQRMLDDLNRILGPDARFNGILCQQLDDGRWEVFLKEEGKGRIALSDSGSGLKTILLVLVYVHLYPSATNTTLGDTVFAFEELENNLHPALLRRLIDYLHELAVNHGTIMFFTTHSNVLIDRFARAEDAQIIHVTHDGNEALARTVTTYHQSKAVLDDIEVRASDILQSNGVIWVEGPSDRLYLNKWIELWSGGQLSEGAHYQCMFYGGRLLAHLSAAPPGNHSTLISLLSMNRNAVVLIDSDKREESDSLNSTKQRVINELQSLGLKAWVTAGREIENYVPARVLRTGLGVDEPQMPQSTQFDSIFELFDSAGPDLSSAHKRDKVALAKQLVAMIKTKEDAVVLDLDAQMSDLCQTIRSWNGK